MKRFVVLESRCLVNYLPDGTCPVESDTGSAQDCRRRHEIGGGRQHTEWRLPWHIQRVAVKKCNVRATFDLNGLAKVWPHVLWFSL